MRRLFILLTALAVLVCATAVNIRELDARTSRRNDFVRKYAKKIIRKSKEVVQAVNKKSKEVAQAVNKKLKKEYLFQTQNLEVS